MMSAKSKLLVLTLVIAASAGGWYYWSKRSAETPAATASRRGGMVDPPPLVTAVTPQLRSVPIYLDGVGTVVPLRTVTVRTQADGRLIEVAFREGQDVRAGDLLARIDPTVYQAQLDQAIAKKAQDEAQLANARLDLERYEKLAADRATSRQQVDTQKALVAQLQAQVQYDQATIDNARAVLSYTRITAPIDGRIGLRLVDEGNIVRSSDSRWA